MLSETQIVPPEPATPRSATMSPSQRATVGLMIASAVVAIGVFGWLNPPKPRQVERNPSTEIRSCSQSWGCTDFTWTPSHPMHH